MCKFPCCFSVSLSLSLSLALFPFLSSFSDTNPRSTLTVHILRGRRRKSLMNAVQNPQTRKGKGPVDMSWDDRSRPGAGENHFLHPTKQKKKKKTN